jgi:UDP-glucose 4-epimerase
MKKKKILLTGASGFIGKNIIDILQKKNFIIYCFVRKLKKNTKKIKYIKHDLLNYIKFDETCDVIIHCSAKSPEKNEFNYTDYKNNILITKNLIEYSKNNKPKKIIFLSSLSIYGKIITKKVNEKTRILSSDLYGKSKLECENLFKEISKKIPVISIRLPGVIGKNSVRNWLSNLINDVKKNKSINIYNLNGSFNNTIHVNDLGKFITKLINIKFKKFNKVCLATKKPIKIYEIINLFKKFYKLDNEKINIKQTKKRNFLIDYGLAKKKFDYIPTSTKSSLVKFLKENKF